MTEAELMTCSDPTPMLELLRGKVSDRKLRLFACACCRRIWPLLKNEQAQTAVEMALRFADGLVLAPELAVAFQADKTVASVTFSFVDSAYRTAKYWTCQVIISVTGASTLTASEEMNTSYAGNVANAAAEAAGCAYAATIPGRDSWDRFHVVCAQEKALQCRLILDIFGASFHPVAISPEVLAWNDKTVRKIAQAIYDDHAFDRLPILADALEDAGCDNADILSHCREPGEHVRGCWVVDLLLGKH